MSQFIEEAIEPFVKAPTLEGKLLLLYDGVCGLCNKTVQFTLKRDKRDSFRFAPLQGELAQRFLIQHGFDPTDLDTVYLVENAGRPDEKLSCKSRAILRTLHEIGGLWSFLSLARVLPRGFTDWGYDLIANRRYKWFGKHEACPLPTEEQKEKFVGMESLKKS